MIHDKKHLKYTAIPNEEMYWERVNRSLGWLGDTKQEQHNKQEKLKNVVIGIAGTGGIGGQLAQRLVRMGVRNLKLADPDTFDISNMNRQMGADLPLKTHKQDMTKRDYHSNPSQEDKTITNNDTVSSALAKLKACAPGNAYVQINDNVFKVNSVSWSQTSKTKLKLKDGRLSFFLENAL